MDYKVIDTGTDFAFYGNVFQQILNVMLRSCLIKKRLKKKITVGE